MGKKIEEWTQEQIDMFIELYKQDKPFPYISEVLKINPATLTRICEKIDKDDILQEVST